MASGSGSVPSPPPDPGGVRVEGLRASYGRGPRRRPALRGVDLTAGPGSVTAVLGRNGAGKTTLFRVLLGFLAPDGGRVTVDGLDPARHRRGRGVGYLPERGALPRGWTVRGLLRRSLHLCPTRDGDPEGAVERALEEAGLAGRADERVETLSLGLGRRALLAFALMGEPTLLLLDEPLGGLDPPGRSELLDRVRALRGGGVTVLLASHDLVAVAGVADRAVVLGDGRVTGTVEGVRAGEPALERLRAAFAAAGAPA